MTEHDLRQVFSQFAVAGDFAGAQLLNVGHINDTYLLDSDHNGIREQFIFQRINQFLFREKGFHGNTRDYYDPDNSFIQKVLERRTGLPIALSVLWVAVARRAGLAIEGGGLPGPYS